MSPGFDPGRAYRGGRKADGAARSLFEKGRDRAEAAETLRTWLQRRTGAARVAVHDLAAPSGAGISNETILFEAEIDAGGSTTHEALVVRISPDPDKRLCRDPLFDEQMYQMAANEAGTASNKNHRVVSIGERPASAGWWSVPAG